MIIPCPHCKPHDFQDKLYGKNQRVHNPVQKSNSKNIIGYRCTICGDVKGTPKQEKDKENKEDKKKK